LQQSEKLIKLNYIKIKKLKPISKRINKSENLIAIGSNGRSMQDCFSGFEAKFFSRRMTELFFSKSAMLLFHAVGTCWHDQDPQIPSAKVFLEDRLSRNEKDGGDNTSYTGSSRLVEVIAAPMGFLKSCPRLPSCSTGRRKTGHFWAQMSAWMNLHKQSRGACNGEQKALERLWPH